VETRAAETRARGEEVRIDDTPEVLTKRLAQYRALTEPLIHYYSEKRKLLTVDGMMTIEHVTREINRILAAIGAVEPKPAPVPAKQSASAATTASGKTTKKTAKSSKTAQKAGKAASKAPKKPVKTAAKPTKAKVAMTAKKAAKKATKKVTKKRAKR
jgi:adenylate kinase